jgi:hypothetical protein
VEETVTDTSEFTWKTGLDTRLLLGDPTRPYGVLQEICCRRTADGEYEGEIHRMVCVCDCALPVVSGMIRVTREVIGEYGKTMAELECRIVETSPVFHCDGYSIADVVKVAEGKLVRKPISANPYRNKA